MIFFNNSELKRQKNDISDINLELTRLKTNLNSLRGLVNAKLGYTNPEDNPKRKLKQDQDQEDEEDQDQEDEEDQDQEDEEDLKPRRRSKPQSKNNSFRSVILPERERSFGL